MTSTRAGEGTGLRDRGTVRVLGRDDVPAAVRVLSARPVENVFVAARVRAAGLDPATLGCQVWGYERDGALTALCHAGSNLVPVNADDEALHAWTEYAGRQRMCASIIGPAETATRFWRMLGDRWGPTWADVRDVRPHQPVMTIVGDPLVAPGPARTAGDPGALGRLHRGGDQDVHRGDRRLARLRQLGRLPLLRPPADQQRAGVRAVRRATACCSRPTSARCRARSARCRASGSTPSCAAAAWRPAAMAAVVKLARTVVPTVSLYVNDYNHAARATYDRVGFTQVGEFATIHY